MATISIDYNSAKKEIYLCGDVAAIKGTDLLGDTLETIFPLVRKIIDLLFL